MYSFRGISMMFWSLHRFFGLTGNPSEVDDGMAYNWLAVQCRANGNINLT